jgi:hypothetical protein
MNETQSRANPASFDQPQNHGNQHVSLKRALLRRLHGARYCLSLGLVTATMLRLQLHSAVRAAHAAVAKAKDRAP